MGCCPSVRAAKWLRVRRCASAGDGDPGLISVRSEVKLLPGPLTEGTALERFTKLLGWRRGRGLVGDLRGYGWDAAAGLSQACRERRSRRGRPWDPVFRPCIDAYTTSVSRCVPFARRNAAVPSPHVIRVTLVSSRTYRDVVGR